MPPNSAHFSATKSSRPTRPRDRAQRRQMVRAATSPMSLSSPQTTEQVSRLLRFASENIDSRDRARRGLWLRRRLRAGARRDRAFARADESDQGNQFRRRDCGRGARRHHRRTAGRGSRAEALLSARSREPARLQHRRKRRDERRRPALSEIWRHPPLRHWPRGRARERRSSAHRRARAQKQDRLRPDRPLRRLRRIARRGHRNHRAPAPVAPGARHSFGRLRHLRKPPPRCRQSSPPVFCPSRSRSRIISRSKPRGAIAAPRSFRRATRICSSISMDKPESVRSEADALQALLANRKSKSLSPSPRRKKVRRNFGRCAASLAIRSRPLA